ncbi:MAG: c-type cytochrome [Bosea sp. (in: a-proteobacteria)]
MRVCKINLLCDPCCVAKVYIKHVRHVASTLGMLACGFGFLTLPVIGVVFSWSKLCTRRFYEQGGILMMRRLVILVSMALVAATASHAQNADAIKQRREAMRAIAQAGGDPFKMTKGELPFNMAPVQAVLKSIEENAPKFKAAFPDNSKVGATEATAKVWDSRTEFNALIDKWVADAKAATTSITDEASFKVEYTKLTASCGGCHGTRGGYSPGLGDSFKRMQTPLQ